MCNALVDVLARRPGGGWARAAQLRTAEDGLAHATVVPRTTTQYQLRVTQPGVQSQIGQVEVQPLLSAVLSRAVIPLHDTSVLQGTLAPAYVGTRLHVQRQMAEGWRTIATVGTGAAGTYRYLLSPGLFGGYSFRVVLPGSSAYRAAISPAKRLVVQDRSLREGDRGGDVRALQVRLQALRGDVGALDGVFGTELRHAVVAFQKTQGLPRTGVADARTRARLAAPAAVRLRYPSAGRSVEVDLTKQVLYLAQDGVVQRVVDVSTGSGELYQSEGVTYRATTPEGRFRIQRKIDGTDTGPLGELYRPSYFYRGWAIHGSASVPTYPASHGCVRVINSAIDRLYPLLTVGTLVTVYR